jgi:hypothetical protein
MLSRETHLEMANELREVKKLLWDGVTIRRNNRPHKFVCLCIEERQKTGEVRSSVAIPLLDWIGGQLGERTATTWAEENGVFVDNYQKYRRAWIDNMIKILES